VKKLILVGLLAYYIGKYVVDPSPLGSIVAGILGPLGAMLSGLFNGIGGTA